MKKKMMPIFLFLSLGLLFSCVKEPSTSQYVGSSYLEEFKQDIEVLKSAEEGDYTSIEDLPFSLEGIYTDSSLEGHYAILLSISYRSVRLNDIRFMLYSLPIEDDNLFAIQVGYSREINIVDEVVDNTKECKGVNVSFRSKTSENSIKALFKATINEVEETYIFTYNQFLYVEGE